MKSVCLENAGYLASLIVGKEYEVFPGENGLVRVIDESGEDYLYPASYFAELE